MICDIQFGSLLCFELIHLYRSIVLYCHSTVLKLSQIQCLLTFLDNYFVNDTCVDFPAFCQK